MTEDILRLLLVSAMTRGLLPRLAVGAVKFIGVPLFRRFVSSVHVGTTLPLLRLEEFVTILALHPGALTDLHDVGTTLPPLRLDVVVTILVLRLATLSDLRFLLVCHRLTRSRRLCCKMRRMIFPGALHLHRPLLRIIRLF